jgi:hypothetical protein
MSDNLSSSQLGLLKSICLVWLIGQIGKCHILIFGNNFAGFKKLWFVTIT